MVNESVTLTTWRTWLGCTLQLSRFVATSAPMPCTPGLNFRPSGRKRTRFTDCDGATAVMLTGLLSASESTTRTWPPATRNPPAGPITWVTESYASGVHAIRRPPPTLCAASIGGSIPTGDGSLQLDAAALAPASSASRSEEHTSELQSQSNLVCR